MFFLLISIVCSHKDASCNGPYARDVMEQIGANVPIMTTLGIISPYRMDLCNKI
jgi:hypothetical protein